MSQKIIAKIKELGNSDEEVKKMAKYKLVVPALSCPLLKGISSFSAGK